MAEVGTDATRPAIVFIGFMAAGKSAAARAAAATLGTAAEDTDELIERQLGESIAALFHRLGEREGEAEFRRREQAPCHALAPEGGGGHEPLDVGL